MCSFLYSDSPYSEHGTLEEVDLDAGAEVHTSDDGMLFYAFSHDIVSLFNSMFMPFTEGKFFHCLQYYMNLFCTIFLPVSLIFFLINTIRVEISTAAKIIFYCQYKWHSRFRYFQLCINTFMDKMPDPWTPSSL